MFRKSVRIDVTIQNSKDSRDLTDQTNIFTVNVKLVSGKCSYKPSLEIAKTDTLLVSVLLKNYSGKSGFLASILHLILLVCI